MTYIDGNQRKCSLIRLRLATIRLSLPEKQILYTDTPPLFILRTHWSMILAHVPKAFEKKKKKTAAKDGDALYSQQEQDQELTVDQIMNSLLPNSD